MTEQMDFIGAVMAEMRASLGNLLHTGTEKEIETRLRSAWGGQAVYIKKSGIDMDARDRAIRARYNMRNRDELQREFGISKGQFYRILKGA